MSIRELFTRSAKWLTIGSILLAVYVGIYIALSAAGEYRPTFSGKRRYTFGLAVMDRSIWQPNGLRWERYKSIKGQSDTRGNVPGYLFSPLIVMDRALWHPTNDYFDE